LSRISNMLDEAMSQHASYETD